MDKIEIVLLGVGILLFFKLIKELAYIKMYAFIIRLKAEGKLVTENDPNGVAGKVEADLKKNASKYF